MVIIHFSKVPRGVKRGLRIKLVTQFCALSGKTLRKTKKVLIKCIENYDLLYKGFGPSGVSVLGVLFGAVGTVEAFLEVSGALR